MKDVDTTNDLPLSYSSNEEYAMLKCAKDIFDSLIIEKDLNENQVVIKIGSELSDELEESTKIKFTSERKFMITVMQTKDEKYFAYGKGAFDVVDKMLKKSKLDMYQEFVKHQSLSCNSLRFL